MSAPQANARLRSHTRRTRKSTPLHIGPVPVRAASSFGARNAPETVPRKGCSHFCVRVEVASAAVCLPHRSKSTAVRGPFRCGYAALPTAARHARERRRVMAKKHKTVATLEQKDCRWPMGDPKHAEFHFCAERSLAGRPYCELHWRMAFQPSRPREARTTVIPHVRRAAQLAV